MSHKIRLCHHATLTYDPPSNLGKNDTYLSFPIYGLMTETKYKNLPYFPLIESPGIIYLEKKQNPANAAQAVMAAVLQGWPVLVLTLIMAALSGIVMWALVS